jgi:S-layer protein
VTLLGNSAKAITIAGNNGLTLTAADTAATSVDASGITLGGFAWTSGALAAAAVVKGSATGTNTVDLSLAVAAATTYTGGTGIDTVTVVNAKNNVIDLGSGTTGNTVTSAAATGNNTVTSTATGTDAVTLGSGNNTVSLGNGVNGFTAGNGNNTYTGGTGVDTVTVGGGSNSLTLGTGADKVSLTAASANVNTYTTIVDAGAGDTITFTDLGTETFRTTKVTLAPTAVFQDYANAVVQAGGNASVNGAFGWFQFGGDTYLVESRHDASAADASFVNGTDMLIKLTGLVDLSTATGVGTATLTLV